MTKPFKKVSLACGCCGCGFQIWESYKDQGGDKGYGICRSCQKEAEKDNERQYKNLFKQIYNKGNKHTKNKINTMIKQFGYEKTRNILVNKGMEEGRFDFVI